MRIQELSAKTGIPKRTVHYYIKEGLLVPSETLPNGYYSFSEEDKARLLLIRALRNVDFSISEIRSMLHSPSASAYYLNRLIKKKNKEITRLALVRDSLLYMEQNLPLNPTERDLSVLADHAGIPAPEETKEQEQVMEAFDYNLVSRFLWENFMPEDALTEYQEFLWEKIRRIAQDDLLPDYRKISTYFQTLSDAGIEARFRSNRELHRQVADLTPSGIPAYVESMKTTLAAFLNSPASVLYWKKNYESFFAPNTRICDSSVNMLMKELSPFFASYLHNVHIVCSMLYEWLSSEDGASLRRRMDRELGDCFDIDRWSHGQLMAMCQIS